LFRAEICIVSFIFSTFIVIYYNFRKWHNTITLKNPAEHGVPPSPPVEPTLLVYVKRNQEHHFRIAGEQIALLEC
jgi:hypothetical protein